MKKLDDDLDVYGLEETVTESEPTEAQEVVYPNVKDWGRVLRSYAKEEGEIRWKIGDCLNDGINQFGPKKAYKEARAVTGKAPATLYEYARVARRVPGGKSSVRTEDLSWNHHKAVEKLWEDPELQRDWLRQALAVDMSVEALKRAIKRQGRPGHVTPIPVESSKKAPSYLKVELDDSHVKVLHKLAAIRKVTPGHLLRDIVIQHLTKPETTDEIENAELIAKAEANQNRAATRERLERETIKSINELLARYDELPGTGPDCSDFVAEWEKANNRKFPFHFAMKRTEFAAHYAGLTAEDCGCGDYSNFQKRQDEEEFDL
jgi:hypothetical protein